MIEIKIFLYLILLVLAVIFGIILSYLCKEEIKNWRKRFIRFSIILFFLLIIVFFINLEFKTPIILSLLFIIIVFLTVTLKSYPKLIDKIIKH
jgi:hypothetical protein